MDKIDLTTKPDLNSFDLDGAVICTLDADELAEQVIEWGDLRELSLTSERIEGGVVSTYPIEIADAVEDLARREANCCGSWLDAVTQRAGSVVQLQITTDNSAGLEVILAMSGHSE